MNHTTHTRPYRGRITHRRDIICPFQGRIINGSRLDRAKALSYVISPFQGLFLCLHVIPDTGASAHGTSRDNVVAQKVKTEIVRDTVYIEKRDSSLRLSSLGAYGLQEDGTPTVSGKLSAVSKILKWIFALICAVVVLIITVKVCLLRR